MSENNVVNFFGLVDEYVIREVGVELIRQNRYQDLNALIQTQKRFRDVCQGDLDQIHVTLINQPPKLEKMNGLFQEWYDDQGLRHREGDLPAVIFGNNSRWSLNEWWSHGDLKRIRGRPSVVYEKIQLKGSMVKNQDDLIVSMSLMLDEVKVVQGKTNKVVIVLVLCDLLMTPSGHSLMQNNGMFKEAIREKFTNLIRCDHVDELRDYYPKLFGEPYPEE